MKKLIFICFILLIIFILGCGSSANTQLDSSNFKNFRYKNKDTLIKIQNAILSPVYDDNNLIALIILRQTMLALGQDMALKVAPGYRNKFLLDEKEQKWFQEVQKMADKGDYFFLVVSAALYFEGIGVKRDTNKAFELWHKSAEQGFGPASFALGKLYEESDIVPRDLNMAVELYRKGGEWGVSEAWYNLGWMMYDGRLGYRNIDLSIEYWEKAMSMGHAKAQLNLGLLYAKGKEVKKNEAFGKKLIKQAAMQGNIRANEILDYWR